MKSPCHLILICLISTMIFGCEKSKEIPDRTIKIISVTQIQHATPGGLFRHSLSNKWSVRGIDVNAGEKFIFSTFDSDFSAVQIGEVVVIYWKRYAGYYLRTIK